MRRPQVPEPRPPGQAAADRRADGPLGVRTPGRAPFVLRRLCSNEKTPQRRERMETRVSSTAREENTDEARDGPEYLIKVFPSRC